MKGYSIMGRWYAAHILMTLFIKENDQNTLDSLENIVIFWGESIDEVTAKATSRGKAEEGDTSASLTWNDLPARRVFSGIRKIIECDLCEGEPLADGVEITYSFITANNVDEHDKLAKGEPSEITYDSSEITDD